MKAIYFDYFSGVSTDILLGALLDAGVSPEFLANQLKMIYKDVSIVTEKVSEQGILATTLSIDLGKEQYVLQPACDVISMINNSNFPNIIKERLVSVFSGSKLSYDSLCCSKDVCFVIGMVLGLKKLKISKAFISVVNVGSGFVKTNQGYSPVYSPITVELLKNISFGHSEAEGQLINPVCAALLSKIGQFSKDIPSGFMVNKIAYGIGKKGFFKFPNLLRVYIGDMETSDDHSEVKIIETNIDDLNPQIYTYVMEKLFQMGALDVYFTPVIMKKGRPGNKVTVLAKAKDISQIVNVMFTETTTIGLRIIDCKAIHMNRQISMVATPWGEAHVKVSRWNGKILNISPEYEDCNFFAKQNNIAIKTVFNRIRSIAYKKFLTKY